MIEAGGALYGTLRLGLGRLCQQTVIGTDAVGIANTVPTLNLAHAGIAVWIAVMAASVDEAV